MHADFNIRIIHENRESRGGLLVRCCSMSCPFHESDDQAARCTVGFADRLDDDPYDMLPTRCPGEGVYTVLRTGELEYCFTPDEVKFAPPHRGLPTGCRACAVRDYENKDACLQCDLKERGIENIKACVNTFFFPVCPHCGKITHSGTEEHEAKPCVHTCEHCSMQWISKRWLKHVVYTHRRDDALRMDAEIQHQSRLRIVQDPTHVYTHEEIRKLERLARGVRL